MSRILLIVATCTLWLPASRAATDTAAEKPLAPPERIDDWLGRVAPSVSTRDLDGKPVSLLELKGRVVLLDFWSIHCAPCLVAMPDLQKIADHFTGRPVAVLGVTGGKTDDDRKELVKRKIGFDQWLDPQLRIKDAFHVRGLPTRILIDKAGIVQAIHVGPIENERATLTSQIEQLLQGEPLIDAEQVARQQARHQAELHKDHSQATSRPAWSAPEHAPSSIEFRRRFEDLRVVTQYATQGDMDGDGAAELILPTLQTRSLQIYRPSSGKFELVRLRDLPGGYSTFPSLRTVNTEGGPRWFVAVRCFDTDEDQQQINSRMVIAMYTTAGDPCWIREYPLGHGRGFCSLKVFPADLDRDGREECIVHARIHPPDEKAGDGSLEPSNHLLVHDVRGNLLASRFVGRMMCEPYVLPASPTTYGQILLVRENDVFAYGVDPGSDAWLRPAPAAASRPAEAGQ